MLTSKPKKRPVRVEEMKVLIRPTPVRNCLLSASLMANIALGMSAYALFTGHAQRSIPVDIQQAVLEQADKEHDIAVTLHGGQFAQGKR